MNLIKEYREKKKMSQEDLAKLVDVRPQTISKWELNQRRIPINKAYIIAKELKIPKAKMLEEFGKEE